MVLGLAIRAMVAAGVNRLKQSKFKYAQKSRRADAVEATGIIRQLRIAEIDRAIR
jgi:hypothetical protein